ncbi:hypothetical protein EPN42_11000 [bacterium]|nr:MAG: hypothetical protein EPN42_11000 [bacterium]
MREVLVEEAIAHARTREASDVYLCAGEPTALLVGKKLYPQETTVSPDDLERFLEACGIRDLSQPKQRLKNHGFCVVDHADSAGTMRLTVTRPGGRYDVSIRLQGAEPPELESLGWPANIAEFAKLPKGLVVITGPGGSGKTSLLSGLVRRILEVGGRPLWMLESPPEFRHAHRQGRVTQYSVGLDGDFPSYAHGVVAAMTATVEVVVVGEATEADVARAALDAARLGKLVFVTMHAGNTVQALEQLATWGVSMTQLAQEIAGVVSLRLIPKLGGGLQPAAEMWLPDDASLALIRSRDADLEGLRERIKSGHGMNTLESALRMLWKGEKITHEDAKRYAVKPGEVL